MPACRLPASCIIAAEYSTHEQNCPEVYHGDTESTEISEQTPRSPSYSEAARASVPRSSSTLKRGFSVALTLCALLVALPARAVQADELTPGYWEQSPLPQTGLATFYAPGMMEYVEGYRQSQGQLPSCPECVGTVALLRAGDIGRKVWLQPPDGERVGPVPGDRLCVAAGC